MLLRMISIALAAGSSAWADCGPGQDTYLTCQIVSSDVVLRICFDDTMVTYAFGPPGSPDLIVREPVQSIDYRPWSGAGVSIWEEVRFVDGDHSYTVYAGGDRGVDDDVGSAPAVYGGVIQKRGDVQISDLTCDAATLQHNWGSDGLFAAKSAGGLRWDSLNQRWR